MFLQGNEGKIVQDLMRRMKCEKAESDAEIQALKVSAMQRHSFSLNSCNNQIHESF